MRRLLVVFLILVSIVAILNINNEEFDFSFENYAHSLEDGISEFPEFPNLTIQWEGNGTDENPNIFKIIGTFFGNIFNASKDVATFTLRLLVYPFQVIGWLLGSFTTIFTQSVFRG